MHAFKFILLIAGSFALALALVGSLIASGLLDRDDKPAVAAPSPGPPTVAPSQLTGTLMLYDYQSGSAGRPCRGDGGYADIREGAQVVVRDGKGAVLGTGALDEGAITSTNYWVFAFSIRRLPRSDFYSIEVSHRGELVYSREDLAERDFHVELTLGR